MVDSLATQMDFPRTLCFYSYEHLLSVPGMKLNKLLAFYLISSLLSLEEISPGLGLLDTALNFYISLIISVRDGETGILKPFPESLQNATLPALQSIMVS